MINFSRSGPDPREEDPDSAIQHLRLSVEADLISRFLKLIERGFKLQIKTGITIRELLCQRFGISEDYVDNRIQTIFLDGKPVDDVDTALLENGSTLALSAAMPGLVGITLRKGGFYASFRSNISYSGPQTSVADDEGEIVLKLFNMVAKELGPAFLENGIMVEGNAFQNFVLCNASDLEAGSSTVQLNGKKIDAAELLKMNWENTEIFLQVTSEVES
jgi:hypothetical protein